MHWRRISGEQRVNCQATASKELRAEVRLDFAGRDVSADAESANLAEWWCILGLRRLWCGRPYARRFYDLMCTP